MTFGERIKLARKSHGYTQRQLADKIGAKHNSISDWENNKNKPDPDTIELLCGVLDVEPNYLMDSWKDKLQNTVSNSLKQYKGTDEKQLIDCLNFNLVQLNKNGLLKVTEYTNDLLNINEYRKKSSLSHPEQLTEISPLKEETSEHLILKAAHNDNAESKEQQLLMDEDFKDMENDW